MVLRYNHRRWRRLRRHQLMVEPLCRFCGHRGEVEPATIADHITPHEGDRTAFFCSPLQSLCKPCHDSLKQQQERRGFMNGVGLDGMPLDPHHPAYARG